MLNNNNQLIEIESSENQAHKCRYCGAPATRYSGVSVSRYDFKTHSIYHIGIQYCCSKCDKDNRWFPIGMPVVPQKIPPRKRRVRGKFGDYANLLDEVVDIPPLLDNNF